MTQKAYLTQKLFKINLNNWILIETNFKTEKELNIILLYIIQPQSFIL